jgi:hypothetical protein
MRGHGTGCAFGASGYGVSKAGRETGHIFPFLDQALL